MHHSTVVEVNSGRNFVSLKNWISRQQMRGKGKVSETTVNHK